MVFCFAFLGSYIFISDQKSRQKAIEIEIAFFSFSWESQGSHIGSFLLCFTFPTLLPLQTDTYIGELVKIFLKLSIKTVQVHLIIWMTLGKSKNYVLYKKDVKISFGTDGVC